MDNLLRKIGLLDSFTIDIKVTPAELVQSISKKLDPPQFDLLDVLNFDKNEFKGFIEVDRFELKRHRAFLPSFAHLAKAHGKFEAREDKLTVTVNVYASPLYFPLTVLGFISISLVAISLFSLIAGIADGEVKRGILTTLGMWAILIIGVGIPLKIIRWSVQNLMFDVARELQDIERKKKAKERI